MFPAASVRRSDRPACSVSADFTQTSTQVGRGKRGCVGRGFGGQVAVESLGVEQQAMGVDGVDMRLPADEGHVMPGPQQQPAIVASDRSGTDDRDLHALLPFGRPCC